jgi:hypothetical protein
MFFIMVGPNYLFYVAVKAGSISPRIAQPFSISSFLSAAQRHPGIRIHLQIAALQNRLKPGPKTTNVERSQSLRMVRMTIDVLASRGRQ